MSKRQTLTAWDLAAIEKALQYTLEHTETNEVINHHSGLDLLGRIAGAASASIKEYDRDTWDDPTWTGTSDGGIGD